MGGKHSSEKTKQQSIHEFTAKGTTGNDVNLSDYKGKVLLVVNVASHCGFTDSNYKALTELYNRYKDKGFEILAFPCNQFLFQEPGTNEQIKDFACTKYKSEFPIFGKSTFDMLPTIFEGGGRGIDKVLVGDQEVVVCGDEGTPTRIARVHVNGPKTVPIYNFLKSSKGGFMGSRIKWNFTKFLVDKDGHVIGRYSPSTSPFGIEKDIKSTLGEL